MDAFEAISLSAAIWLPVASPPPVLTLILLEFVPLFAGFPFLLFLFLFCFGVFFFFFLDCRKTIASNRRPLDSKAVKKWM